MDKNILNKKIVEPKQKERRTLEQGIVVGEGKAEFGSSSTVNIKLISGNSISQNQSSTVILKNVPILTNCNNKITENIKEGDYVYVAFFNEDLSSPYVVSSFISATYNSNSSSDINSIITDDDYDIDTTTSNDISDEEKETSSFQLTNTPKIKDLRNYLSNYLSNKDPLNLLNNQ